MNVGEDVLVFYSDHQSFNSLVDMMQSERERLDESGPLLYHINLVELLACCTEGKNVYTEIKCHSLLPLDDIVRVVTHPDCIPEVRGPGNSGTFLASGCEICSCVVEQWGELGQVGTAANRERSNSMRLIQTR